MQVLAGGFISSLMKEPNDLVVNTASMIAIDLSAGKYVKDVLAFGKNPQVHHCNYFVRPEVCNALARWLRLVEPEPTAAPTRSPVGRDPFMRLRRDTPAQVDTDILIAPANAPVRELRRSIEKKSPSYVVVNRDFEGRVLNYAFPTEGMLGITARAPANQPLIDALDLHEGDASPTETVDGAGGPPSEIGGASPSQGLSVILDRGRPIGVLPEKTDLPNADGLVAPGSDDGKPSRLGGSHSRPPDAADFRPPRRQSGGAQSRLLLSRGNGP